MIDPAGSGDRRGMVERLSGFVRSDAHGGTFYGWRLVVIGFLVILVGRELGDGLIGTAWGRGFEGEGIGLPWVALVVAASAIGGLAILWFAGWGVDRLGPRRMAQIGLPLVGLVALFAALPAPGVLQFATVGTITLGMMGAYLPAITALNNWFRDRLVVALAMMLFGVAIGGVVVDLLLPLLVPVVDWRLITVVCGAAIVVVALPLARMVHDRPGDRGEYPDGLAPAATANIPNYSWREAVRSRQLWLLVAAVCCVVIASSVADLNAGLFIANRGGRFEPVIGFRQIEQYASIAFILVGGLASYRFPIQLVLAAAAIIQVVGMVLMLTVSATMLTETAIVLGAASGIPTAPSIAAVGIYFGRRNFGVVTVAVILIKGVASNAAVAGAGYVNFLTAAYVPIFVAAAVLSLIGAGLYLMLGQPRLAPSQRAEDPAIS